MPSGPEQFVNQTLGGEGRRVSEQNRAVQDWRRSDRSALGPEFEPEYPLVPVQTTRRGTLSEVLNSGGHANATLYRDGETYTETVYDYLLADLQTLASGTKIFATYLQDEDKWYVTAAECG